MQPPPRKGNYAKFLKNLHTEQINKLSLKNQHECELLEDIKNFTVKRSALERTYAEELLKLTSQFLNKKAPHIPDIKLEGSEEKWNMWSVWRTVLEENEKLAQARLAAVEIFQQQIADDAKILRSHKAQGAKKCLDQLTVIQKELQTCVQEVDKTKKFYFDEEHSAHGVRDKARDIEEKLKKKKGGFFTSITSLQKNSAKYSTKRDQLDEKSTGARNDYLLCLAAANAHQNRYFLVDLQLCMTTMESGVFDKVAEYLSLMGRTELLTCSAWQNSFTNIRDQAKQLSREYNIQCCYLYYPVLKQHIQYPFEACDNDPVDTITAEHDSAAATLSKEARRWATRIARENNVIRESVKKLQIYNALRESGQKVDPNDQTGPDLETKIEEMKQNIRKAETAKAKAEARIEVLREGGVNVDEWLQEAESLNVQDIQRSASSLSDHPSSDSFYDSDFADGETVAVPQPQGEKQQDKDSEGSQQDQFENAEVDAMLEQERQRIEQLTAGWDDPTQVDWGTEEFSEPEPIMRQESTPSIPLLKCTALYSYTAQNPDELTIVENEQLEVVGEGDGDGWLKARNYKGEEGYVPHNYLDVEREQTATTPGLVNQISFSSVDYTVDNEEDVQVTTSETNQSPEQVSVISVQQKVPESPPSMYCCALYDYDGEGEEELTFEEGQIIKIISKCAHSVDDGWWKGELEGRVGNFPSLVVEECDEYGEPLTNQSDETPPQSAPPVFTPPEAPDFLMGAQVIITQPTPSVEHPQQPPPVPKGQTDASPSPEGGFSMVLSRDQHQQYGSQFQETVPTIDVPSVEIVDEDDHDGAAPAPNPDDFGLGVAQIVITAATPMMEEPEHPFPPPEEPPVNHAEADVIPEEDEDEAADEPPAPPPPPPPPPPAPADDADDAPFAVSSSTGSDGETTGPSTAENSVSHAAPPPPPPDAEPKQVVGGRASIPDELEPHQLARLQDLKESNA